MRTVKEVLAGVKEAGLDLVGFKDCTHEGDRPWSVVLSEPQCAAVYRTALQCTARRCSAWQCTARHCSVLQCMAVYSTALQCTAVYCMARTALALFPDSPLVAYVVVTSKVAHAN